MSVRSFVVPGKPGAKGRPRFSVNRRRGYVSVRTPVDTLNYEHFVVLEYDRLYNEADPFPAKAPLYIKIDAYYPIPSSTSNKQREKMLKGEIRPSKKPDVDNVFKIIADALNNVAYHDDSQIVSAVINKYYSEKPRVEVEIGEIVENH